MARTQLTTELQIRTKVGNFTISTVADGALYSTVVFNDAVEFDMGSRGVYSATIVAAASAHQKAVIAQWALEEAKRKQAEEAAYEAGDEGLVEIGGSSWTTETAQAYDRGKR